MVSAALSVLIFIGSIQDMIPGLSLLPRQAMWYILFVLTTPVQFWAGRHFYQNAWASLRHGSTNMNTLVVVGTSSAYGYSAALTFFPELLGAHASHGALTTIRRRSSLRSSCSENISSAGKVACGEAIKKLMGLQPRPPCAPGRHGAGHPIEDVENGDLIVVRPGEKVLWMVCIRSGTRLWTRPC